MVYQHICLCCIHFRENSRHGSQGLQSTVLVAWENSSYNAQLFKYAPVLTQLKYDNITLFLSLLYQKGNVFF